MEKPCTPIYRETIAGLQTLEGQVGGDHCYGLWQSAQSESGRAGSLSVGETIELGIRGSTIAVTRLNDGGVDIESSQLRHSYAVDDLRFDGTHWTALVRSADQQLRIVVGRKVCYVTATVSL